MPVSLYRDKYPEAFRHLRLVSRQEIATDFWRVRLAVDRNTAPLSTVASSGAAINAGSDALIGSRAPGAGDHGRVYVGRADDDWAVPVDASGVPAGEFRIETVVDSSPDEGWIDLDLLVHRGVDGEPAGLIGPWAAAAPWMWPRLSGSWLCMNLHLPNMTMPWVVIRKLSILCPLCMPSQLLQAQAAKWVAHPSSPCRRPVKKQFSFTLTLCLILRFWTLL